MSMHPDVLVDATRQSTGIAFWAWGRKAGAQLLEVDGTSGGTPIEKHNTIPGCRDASAHIYLNYSNGVVTLSAASDRDAPTVAISPNDALQLAREIIRYAGEAAKLAASGKPAPF